MQSSLYNHILNLLFVLFEQQCIRTSAFILTIAFCLQIRLFLEWEY